MNRCIMAYLRSSLILAAVMVLTALPASAWAVSAGDYNAKGMNYVRQGEYDKSDQRVQLCYQG